MPKILVTGGCGYIGSHTIVELLAKGYDVVSIDDLSNSDGSALQGIFEITGKEIKNYPVNIGSAPDLIRFFEKEGPIDVVIHFAAYKAVYESVQFPLTYYKNNISGLINLMEVMKSFDCNHLIFSSSCSVYGDSEELPVSELTPLGSIQSPYARTKLMGEQILEDCTLADKTLKVISLRYFNPAGAHLSNHIGESPTVNASNLVPVITENAIGKRSGITVFGNDYPTSDGTCVRDYIHVSDIGEAHALAVDYVLNSMEVDNYEVFNLGSAKGNTVLEVIDTFQKVNNVTLNYNIGPRREGDVIAVYADNKKATEKLHWNPELNLEDIVRTAWEWEKKRSGG